MSIVDFGYGRTKMLALLLSVLQALLILILQDHHAPERTGPTIPAMFHAIPFHAP